MRQWLGKDSGTGEKQRGGSNEEESVSDDEVGVGDDARFPAEKRPHRTRDETFESLRPHFPLKVLLQSIIEPADYPLWRVPCQVSGLVHN
jgi:hypothetical protein